MCSFSCLRVTPACTTASRSCSCTASTWFIRERSITRPALHGQNVALERGADAVGDHRHAVAAAGVDDVAHFLGAFRENHRVGRGIGEIGLVLAVVLAHRRRGRDAFCAEQRLPLGQNRLVKLPCLVHAAILV